jgi:hypothetical protein
VRVALGGVSEWFDEYMSTEDEEVGDVRRKNIRSFAVEPILERFHGFVTEDLPPNISCHIFNIEMSRTLNFIKRWCFFWLVVGNIGTVL